MYKLFSSRFSGHSYKVVMFLVMSAIPYELIEVDLAVAWPSRGQDFLAASHFGEVPVLIDGSHALCQSNQILLYLAETNGQNELFSPAEHVSIGEWLFWESNRIGFFVANLRLHRRFKTSCPTEVEGFFRDRAHANLSVLDRFLTSAKFLVADRISIADVSCSGYLFWLHEAGLDIDQWPHVRTWLDRIAEHPRWNRPDALMTRA